MFFIILGAGVVGIRIAQILSEEGHEVVLIEKNKARVSHIYNRIDCRLIIEEGLNSALLEDAGVKEADYFIATTNLDEINLIACMLVKKLAPDIKIIARIREQEYLKNTQESQVFPIDHIVHPEQTAAMSIIRSIEIGGGASDVFKFRNFGNLIMRNHIIDSDSLLTGTKLKDINDVLHIPTEIQRKFLVTLIHRKEDVIIPTGDVEFLEGDEIFLLGPQMVLEKLLQYLGKTVRAAKNIKNIIIVGASAVAEQIVDIYQNVRERQLTTMLGKTRFANREITIIDDDVEKCNYFADKYPDTTVLHADVTEEDILEDLEIMKADMLIAATDHQERNIVIAAHCHNLGIPLTSALVHTTVYFKIAAELGINMSISPRSEVVSSIIGFLRGSTNLYSLVEGSYGIFECIVNPKSPIVYTPISNIILPPKCLIISSSSSNTEEGEIASGNTIIQPNDTLLCISHPESMDKLYTLFGTPSKETSK